MHTSLPKNDRTVSLKKSEIRNIYRRTIAQGPNKKKSVKNSERKTKQKQQNDVS